jgi:hypothetical protein
MWLSELLAGLIITFGVYTASVDMNTNAITLYEAPVYLDVSCGAVNRSMWKCTLTPIDPNLRVTYK